MTFAYIGVCTLFLGSRFINNNSSEPSKPKATLEEQAIGLTEEIKIQGLTPDLDRRASEVSKAIEDKHRGSNDSFYPPSPHETMALVELKQALSQAKR